jgi:hypothetical protein
MMNTLRTVALASEFGWIMSYSAATLRSASARIGKLTVVFCVSLMSLTQLPWESSGSTLTAIGCTPRRANSPASAAVLPSSVVQTGVKSAGCENSTTQESPAQRWIGPSVEACRKSGAVSPSRKVAMGVPVFNNNPELSGTRDQTQTTEW